MIAVITVSDLDYVSEGKTRVAQNEVYTMRLESTVSMTVAVQLMVRKSKFFSLSLSLSLSLCRIIKSYCMKS
jgi:hypothetical protein